MKSSFSEYGLQSIYRLCCLFLFLCHLPVAADLLQTSEDENTLFKIAVLQQQDRAELIEHAQTTVNYLNTVFTDIRFTMQVCNAQEIIQQAADFDFMFVNPSLTIRLEKQQQGQALATLRHWVDRLAYNQLSNVLFTHIRRDDIQTLQDVHGKLLALVDEHSFSGSQLSQYQLQTYMDLNKELHLRPQASVLDVVKKVQTNLVDVGSLPSGVLERLQQQGKIDIEQFKILAAQKNNELPLAHSGHLYPEWAWIASPRVSQNMLDNVAISLLTMARKADYSWMIPANYQSVHQVLQSLHYPPYENYGKITFSELFKQHANWFYFALTAFFAFSVASINFTYLYHGISKVQANLEAELKERLRTEEALQAAIEQAELSNRSKSQFLANMSHELRTPLNAVIGYSEMLQEEAEDLGQTNYLPDLKKIHGAGKHLLALINDILDLSKIEAGKMDLYLETFNINDMISDVVTTIYPLIEKNHNNLEIHCVDDLGTMHADLTKMRQNLFNLLSNASKFTKNGNVALYIIRETTGGNDWVVFRICDSGIGMSPEQQARIFSAFTQADTSTTRQFGGTGLGLSITKKFCEMMGGEIKVESQEGIGSTFVIRLPTTVVEDVLDDDEIGSRHIYQGHILIVDRDTNLRDNLKRTLLEQGYEVFVAADAKQALKLSYKIHPNFVILDSEIPEGWSILVNFKTNADLQHIPVIVTTAEDHQVRAKSLGAVAYLEKPFEMPTLLELLQKHRTQKHWSCLVIEDDINARTALGRLLEHAAWFVFEAHSGQMGLRFIRHHRPDLILLDLNLPEMNGFEFIRQLRSKPQWRSIPIIVITARDLSPAEQKRLNNEVESILFKGTYTREQLLDTIDGLVCAVASDSKDMEQGTA
ncbi:MAG: response regulator [Thiotrichaceae bacterium]|nr:response regulator [Thiotrichaceae bacterium]